MNKRKQFWIISICMVLVICFFPIPSHINKELTGTGFYPKGHKQESLVTEETIRIKGWYFQFLFWKNRFWGDIYVVSEDPEHERALLDNPTGVPFWKEDFVQGRWSTLPYYDDRINQVRFAGIIVEKGAFDEILYVSNEEDDWHIAFPAANREEAVALANKLYLPME